jgi:hypothetical protein
MVLYIHLGFGPKGVELRLMVHQNMVASRSRVPSNGNPAAGFPNAASATLTMRSHRSNQGRDDGKHGCGVAVVPVKNYADPSDSCLPTL